MIIDYGKIYAIGHRDLAQIFDGPVTVQEKIDGSQFSAMVGGDGVLHCRSKGGPLDVEEDSQKGLFAPSIRHLLSVQDRLVIGAVYRFEAMARPKHNVLAYERVPAGNLVLYDGPGDLTELAAALGVEAVQTLFIGLGSEADLPKFLAAKPQLGGAMVEGVVVKNYALGLKGKLVAPRFQEIMHNRPARAPKESPVIDLGRKYCSEARWEKAVAHLRDAGKLTETHADIGPLIKEVIRDILEECGPDIKNELFEAFAKDLRGGWIQGLPQWYQKRVP